MSQLIVSQESLDISNGYRLVQFTSPACVFTGMGADAPTYSRQDIVTPDYFEGIFEPSFFCQGYIGLDINPQRTVALTKGLHCLFDDRPAGKTGPTGILDWRTSIGSSNRTNINATTA